MTKDIIAQPTAENQFPYSSNDKDYMQLYNMIGFYNAPSYLKTGEYIYKKTKKEYGWEKNLMDEDYVYDISSEGIVEGCNLTKTSNTSINVSNGKLLFKNPKAAPTIVDYTTKGDTVVDNTANSLDVLFITIDRTQKIEFIENNIGIPNGKILIGGIRMSGQEVVDVFNIGLRLDNIMGNITGTIARMGLWNVGISIYIENNKMATSGGQLIGSSISKVINIPRSNNVDIAFMNASGGVEKTISTAGAGLIDYLKQWQDLDGHHGKVHNSHEHVIWFFFVMTTDKQSFIALKPQLMIDTQNHTDFKEYQYITTHAKTIFPQIIEEFGCLIGTMLVSGDTHDITDLKIINVNDNPLSHSGIQNKSNLDIDPRNITDSGDRPVIVDASGHYKLGEKRKFPKKIKTDFESIIVTGNDKIWQIAKPIRPLETYYIRWYGGHYGGTDQEFRITFSHRDDNCSNFITDDTMSLMQRFTEQHKERGREETYMNFECNLQKFWSDENEVIGYVIYEIPPNVDNNYFFEGDFEIQEILDFQKKLEKYYHITIPTDTSARSYSKKNTTHYEVVKYNIDCQYGFFGFHNMAFPMKQYGYNNNDFQTISKYRPNLGIELLNVKYTNKKRIAGPAGFFQNTKKILCHNKTIWVNAYIIREVIVLIKKIY